MDVDEVVSERIGVKVLRKGSEAPTTPRREKRSGFEQRAKEWTSKRRFEVDKD
jgi:hypothetical protein